MYKKLLLIFSLFSILLPSKAEWSQTPPWEYTQTNFYNVINIVSTEFYIEENDVVGVFAYSETDQAVICVGYNTWTTQNNFVKAYGFDNQIGPRIFGRLYLKVWKHQYDCVVPLQTNTIAGSDNFDIQNNGFTSTLEVLNPFSDMVNLSFSLLDIEPERCKTQGSISLNSNTVTGDFPPFEYTLFDAAGKAISSNGYGVYSGLNASNYTLQIKDSLGCKQTKAITVEKIAMDISYMSTETIDDKCERGGQVLIDPSTIEHAERPILFILEDRFTEEGFSSNTGVFENVPSGNYTIEIIDANACTASQNIAVLADNFSCNEENILAPFSNDPSAKEIKFECSGNLTIVDKNGAVVTKINNGENIWDATNNSGSFVPNGSYFIYCDGNYIDAVEVLK